MVKNRNLLSVHTACCGKRAKWRGLPAILLLLAVRLERREDRGLWLKQLFAWVQEEESRARKETSGHEWLLGLSYTRPRADASAPEPVAWLLNQVEYFKVRRATVWRSLAHRILASPESPHLREADEALRMLGVSLAGN